MSGHSKWANIKHKKGAADARKGKVFSKIAKEIMISVRASGADPSSNLTLRQLMQKAKQANMPSDNVDRAIKRGTGEAGGAQLEEVMFEGYISGIGVIVQALTDNRNRTVAEVRHTFEKYGANMAQQGQLMRSFQRRGCITVDASKATEDKLMEIVLEAGADDLTQEEGQFEILTDPAKCAIVTEAINKAGIETTSSEVMLLPLTWVPVTAKDKAGQMMRFFEDLEELDDVQNVYSNADIDSKLAEELSKG